MTEQKLASTVRDLTRAVRGHDREAACGCLKDVLEDCSATHATGVRAALSCPDLDAACADLKTACQPQAAGQPVPVKGVDAITPDDIGLIFQFVQMVIRWWKGQ